MPKCFSYNQCHGTWKRQREITEAKGVFSMNQAERLGEMIV